MDDGPYIEGDGSSQMPCMAINTKTRQMFIFDSSSDGYAYALDGYCYVTSLDNISFEKETVFEEANMGWWPRFELSEDGQLTVSHFSFAGYYGMASTRNGDGTWTTDYVNDIHPDDFKAQNESKPIVLVFGGGGDTPILTDCLVAYYPFNGNANDESGNGNDGTVIGHVELAADRFGNPDSAYRFFGEPLNYISVPDDESLHCSTFTLSAWVYTDAEDYGSGYLINKGRDIENGTYRLSARGIGATTEYGGVNDASIEYPVTKVWHMATGTVEGDVARFYLDGVLMAEKTLSHPFVYNNSDPLTLGMHYYTGVPDFWAYPLLGVLDDVRIYNRALSADEVKALYTMEDGLVAYYPFNGNANDESGNGNDGTPMESVTLTTGVNGDANGAYQFGGYDNPGHIYVPKSESLQFSEGCTFAFYMKPTSWTGMNGWGRRSDSDSYQAMIAKSHDQYGISMGFFGTSEKIRFNAASYTSTWVNLYDEETNKFPELDGNYLNKWVHVAYAYGSGKKILYINGNMIYEKDCTPDFAEMNGQDMYFGKFRDSWYPLNGVLDEIRIYNRTLTAEEVKELAKYADKASDEAPKGDVNGDNAVNVADIGNVIDVMAEGSNDPAADVNGDGVVNVADIAAIIDIMSGKGTDPENPDPQNPEEKFYTSCPDDHHPHIIDLGLPSGTKWACCNVGASKPEEYGDYFAWGETQPKEVYSWETYIHCDGSYDTCHDLGSDIAGTEYDAAMANWKAPWRMPTLEQRQELIDNCTSEWTTQNDVNGRKFTGPNGGTVFLPAAGLRWYSDLNYAGSDGFYWSSTLSESRPNLARSLYFGSGGVSTNYDDNRYYGFTVRPVR